jgi:predicted SAM-dependent methyltransferase
LELQIKELKRILKPTGTLLIAVPNYKSFDAGYYKQFWAAYDVPRHLWHFSKTSIDRLVEQEGMKVVSVRPMKFDSFYVSLLSEKYKTGKMNYVNAFFVGLYSNWKGSQTKEYSSHIYVIKNS